MNILKLKFQICTEDYGYTTKRHTTILSYDETPYLLKESPYKLKLILVDFVVKFYGFSLILA